MTKKIPGDAFEQYHAMGAHRSYEALARKYGVSKRSIVRLAHKDRWQQRLAEREKRVREAVENKVEETLEQLKSRHLRVLQAIQAKSLKALKELPMSHAMDAVRALELCIKQERLIHGEATERNETDVTTIIKREYERWMKNEAEGHDVEHE